MAAAELTDADVGLQPVLTDEEVGLTQAVPAAAPATPVQQPNEDPSLAALFLEEASQPFVTLPKPQVETDDAGFTRFLKGLGQTGVGLIEGLESPLGVSTLAAAALPGVGGALSKAVTGVASKALPIAGRTTAAAAGLGFGVPAFVTGLRDLYTAQQAGDPEAAGRALGNVLAGGAMQMGAVGLMKPRGAAKPEIRAEALPKTVKYELASPETRTHASKVLEDVIAELPQHIKQDLNIKGITITEFPATLEGSGAIYKNGRILIEEGEPINPRTLEHEVLHQYVLKHPELYDSNQILGMEKAVDKLQSELRRATTETPMLPAFLPHAESKTVFSQPFGAGRVPVLGRIVDPNARMSTGPLPEALAAYAAERHGVAPAAASNVGLRLKAAGIDEAFPVDPKTGEFTTVQPVVPGQSLHPHDVLTALQKNPESYVLSTEQRAAFSKLEKWRSELDALEKEHGTSPAEIAALAEESDTSYFPRIVIERPATDVAPLGGGSRVGAKQFFQKKPIFETEQEGVARGYRYEPSIVARAVTRTERAYRAIADRRLANDPTLGARTRKQVESELREAYSEELGAGMMKEEKLQQIVDSVEHKGSVWGHPGFAGKIFEPETANALNKAFPQADSSFRHNFVKVNNALKAFRLSADVGAPFIQGLPTLFFKPRIWAKATGNAYKAILDENVLARYAQDNAAAVTELAQLGSSVGRLPEFMAGLEKGSIVERIPVAGAVFRAGGRHFETFMDVAKVELWKAWREVTPTEQRLPLVRTIESLLLSGRMESAGVSRNRALVERALLLAPSYYRGAVNLVAAIGERGVAGQVARRALTAYMVGGMATFYGLGLALGMKEEEIHKRLDPTNSAFMLWEVQIDDRRLNVGFGGIYRSLLRLAGNMVKTSAENPDKWLSLTPQKNPLVRWYRGHAAAVPALTWDAFTGRDYLYNEVDVTNLGQSVLPIAASPVIRGEGPAAAAASVAGLTAFEEKGR